MPDKTSSGKKAAVSTAGSTKSTTKVADKKAPAKVAAAGKKAAPTKAAAAAKAAPAKGKAAPAKAAVTAAKEKATTKAAPAKVKGAVEKAAGASTKAAKPASASGKSYPEVVKGALGKSKAAAEAATKKSPSSKSVVKKAADAVKDVAKGAAEKVEKIEKSAVSAAKNAAEEVSTASGGKKKAKAAVSGATEGVTQKAQAVLKKDPAKPKPKTTPTVETKTAVVAKPMSKSAIAKDPFLSAQKATLEREREQYVAHAAALKAEAEQMAAEMEPGDTQFDEESGEGGTANIDREHNLRLSSQALQTVDEIDRALAKMEKGTYGLCEHCGNPISEPRLEALPFAALCVGCKSGGLARR